MVVASAAAWAPEWALASVPEGRKTSSETTDHFRAAWYRCRSRRGPGRRLRARSWRGLRRRHRRGRWRRHLTEKESSRERTFHFTPRMCRRGGRGGHRRRLGRYGGRRRRDWCGRRRGHWRGLRRRNLQKESPTPSGTTCSFRAARRWCRLRRRHRCRSRRRDWCGCRRGHWRGLRRRNLRKKCYRPRRLGSFAPRVAGVG